MHTTTNRNVYQALRAARVCYDDTETISPLRKEDAGSHDRPYGKVQIAALKFLGMVLGRHIV